MKRTTLNIGIEFKCLQVLQAGQAMRSLREIVADATDALLIVINDDNNNNNNSITFILTM